MKIFVSLVCLLWIATVAFGQTVTQTMAKARSLIDSKQYNSAFVLLEKFDPANANPDIALLKQEIVINYFVTSIMHQTFALKDLSKDEEISDFRGKEGSFELHLFDVEKVMGSLLAHHPNDCRLYKALGDFYYDVYLKYDDKWLKDEKELLRLMETNFQKAEAGDCADYYSYFVLGHISLIREKNAESIPFFLKSIRMNPTFANAKYNLAYAYLCTGAYEKAIPYAQAAFDLYQSPGYKGDAARMLGQLYEQLEQTEEAIANYEKADQIDPNNYDTLKALLRLYVQTDNPNESKMMQTFYALAPDNPTLYNDLEEICTINQKENDLILFYKYQLDNGPKDDKMQGNLHFFLGRLSLATDKPSAKVHLLLAKDKFGKIFGKDEELFKTIDELLQAADR
ncbi:MAG: tetratricopeptide repeat protein [Marinilabiliales bacterium]|nr:tetratricopeptide repeat protein [Marinilabiliales bacterium]